MTRYTMGIITTPQLDIATQLHKRLKARFYLLEFTQQGREIHFKYDIGTIDSHTYDRVLNYAQGYIDAIDTLE